MTMKQCIHFGLCGGCSLQDIPYPQQLENKETKIKKLLSVNEIEVEPEPINSFAPWWYRNKMEFTFAQEETVICGLHQKNPRGKVFDVKECLIFSKEVPKILEAVKRFVQERHYSVYNRFTHKGFLRNLIIRETKFTQECMVGIVTSSEEHFAQQEFVRCLAALKLGKKITSIYWIENDSLSDSVVFEKKNLLYGNPYIREELNGLTFQIGIDSFFQVNPAGIKSLYSKLRSSAQIDGSQRVLDLFCGVGCIGLFLASGAKFVWGVEYKEEIIEAAYHNAKENKVENISFFVEDARRFLSSQGFLYKDIDILVINPPRSGLSKKIVRGILRLAAKKIFYSSCNPETFTRDLKPLTCLYKVYSLEPFDLFPHTPHIECLAELRKKETVSA
jgi:23S rRNA (uracil-5-)-methyltransferase RumA